MEINQQPVYKSMEIQNVKLQESQHQIQDQLINLPKENQEESSQYQSQTDFQPTKQQKNIIKELRNLGLKFNPTQVQKQQFTQILSGAVSKFFTYILTNISKKQTNIYKKLGWIYNDEKKYLQIQRKPNVQNKQQSQEKIQDVPKTIKEEQKIKTKFRRIIKRRKNGQNKESSFDRKVFVSKRVRNQFGQFIAQKSQGQPNFNGQISEKSIDKINNQILNTQKYQQTQQKNMLLKNMQSLNCRLKNNRICMKGMPKKPVSSFFFFFKSESKNMHQQMEKMQGNKQMTYGSVLAKKISQKWQSLSLEQKLPFKKMSQITRAQYRKDMDQFKNNNAEVFQNFKRIRRIKANQSRRKKLMNNLNQKQNQVNSQSQNQVQQNSESIIKNQGQDKQESQQKESQQLKIKPRKIPRSRFKSQHLPKNPAPSFFFFYNTNKLQLSKKHNVKAGAQITKYAAALWNTMTSQQKKPFEIMADDRRKQYNQQMIQFSIDYPQQYASMIKYKSRTNQQVQPAQTKIEFEKKSQTGQPINQQLDVPIQQIDSLQGIVIKKPKSQCYKKIKAHQPNYKHQRPKAPLSSFFIFYKQNNASLAQLFKQAHVAKLVQCASQVWKKMSDEQKRPHILKSQQLRKTYYEQMQEYKRKFPEQVKQRRLDLKKKHQDEQLYGKKKRNVRKNNNVNVNSQIIEQIILQKSIDVDN